MTLKESHYQFFSAITLETLHPLPSPSVAGKKETPAALVHLLTTSYDLHVSHINSMSSAPLMKTQFLLTLSLN